MTVPPAVLTRTARPQWSAHLRPAYLVPLPAVSLVVDSSVSATRASRRAISRVHPGVLARRSTSRWPKTARTWLTTTATAQPTVLIRTAWAIRRVPPPHAPSVRSSLAATTTSVSAPGVRRSALTTDSAWVSGPVCASAPFTRWPRTAATDWMTTATRTSTCSIRTVAA